MKFTLVFNIINLQTLIMRFELFIANRLKTGKVENGNTSTPSLNVAITGMTLAITIIILSITIVCGFKKEISSKIYNLDSHIKIISSTTDNKISEIKHLTDNIENVSYISEKSVVLKTNNDFKGIIYKGVDENYDWSYLEKNLIVGKLPNINDTIHSNNIIISKKTADEIHLNVGDKVYLYFIDKSVKARNLIISGIYNTGLVEFDKSYIIGNSKVLNNISNVTSYIGVNCKNYGDIDDVTLQLNSYFSNDDNILQISNTTRNNISYFTWLKLLDTNVFVIIIIMILVTSFTLISAMLMIVLERINFIGILKIIGTTNDSIRRIFIYLTNKLILKSLLLGNIIGLGISVIQKEYKIITLDTEAYYISHVPIEIDWFIIIILNIGILLAAYISLLAPSHIISKIEPNKSIKFE